MKKRWAMISAAAILLVVCFGVYRYANQPVDVNIEFAYGADVAGVYLDSQAKRRTRDPNLSQAER